MTYLYVAVASIGDPTTFAEAGRTWAGERLREYGALDFTTNEVVMGGEMAGTFMAAMETETVDAAMRLQASMYADPELLAVLADSQVQVHRRTIHRVRAEFGARDGDYGSVLYLAGAIPADVEANFAHAWSHVQKGSNGMLASEVVANGPSTFSAASVTWTDSLDSMLAAAAENFADPVTHEIMAATNTTVVGRVLTRRLF